MFLIKNCSITGIFNKSMEHVGTKGSMTGIFNKSMEHVGTKEIVPYPLYVPPLEGSLLEVLLYAPNADYVIKTCILL